MFKRQFSLLVMATLLLSPTLVQANELGESTNLSVGNIRLQTNSSGGVSIQTPNINLNTAQSPEDRVWISRTTRRRIRTSIRRPIRTTTILRGRVISSPSLIRQSTIFSQPTIIRQSTIDPEYRSINRTSTIRSSTVRTSSNGSESISEQHNSVQCSPGSGSSVSQSTQTINGRTVSSEVRTDCP